jgi:putative oxidoreductase
MGPYTPDPQTFSIGILVVRLVIGLIMAAHGTQKLLGWFGGYGLRGTGEYFVQLGFQPGPAFAAAASLSEIVSGVLVALGFLGRSGRRSWSPS